MQRAMSRVRCSVRDRSSWPSSTKKRLSCGIGTVSDCVGIMDISVAAALGLLDRLPPLALESVSASALAWPPTLALATVDRRPAGGPNRLGDLYIQPETRTCSAGGSALVDAPPHALAEELGGEAAISPWRIASASPSSAIIIGSVPARLRQREAVTSGGGERTTDVIR